MKKIKILTFILVVILITAIAFLGVYTHVQNRMENQVKDYSYAMDLSGARYIRLSVSGENKTVIKDAQGNEVQNADTLTDEQISEKGYTKEEIPYNSEDAKTLENFKKSKQIIEKRLKKLNVQDYIVKLDDTNGDILVELPEDDNTDYVLNGLATTGKFEIIDNHTQEVLMDNSDIRQANVMYGGDQNDANATMVYLNVQFKTDSIKKFEDITTKYNGEEVSQNDQTEETAETSDETSQNQEETQDATNETNTENVTDTQSSDNTENTETSEDETEETYNKEVTLKIDGETIMTTSFDEPIRVGILRLTVGQASSEMQTIQDNLNQANGMAIVLDTGNLPLTYSIEGNEYISSDITENEIQIAEYIILGIIAVAMLVLIIRYKTNGILGVFSYIGLISLFLLIIRYTNVIISLQGVCGIILVLILNYVFINSLLSKIKKQEGKEITKATNETMKNFFIKIIPICIMVVTFSLIKWIPISSFGMVMFWGIALIALYNLIVTKYIFKAKAKEEE